MIPEFKVALTLRVRPNEYAIADAWAKFHGCTKSEFVRRLLAEKGMPPAVIMADVEEGSDAEPEGGA
jgi:hypothetical protein